MFCHLFDLLRSTLGVSSPIVKTTIYKQLSREKLVRVLPEIFTVQVPGSIPQPITAVVFRDRVVTSRIARKAIGRVGTDFGASVIFAALDFTREASELAAAHKISVITSNGSWGGYFWSDDRLVEIRTSIATHRPLQPQPISSATGNASQQV